jgi:hypothetical protein
MNLKSLKIWTQGLLCAAFLTGIAAFSGCQVSVGGQTLPSPNYMEDDIQYFPSGPEFKLEREANALSEARAAAGIGN